MIPVQVDTSPINPRNNVAGIKANPIRKGMHRPPISNPVDTIMQGRGRMLLIHLIHPAIKSFDNKLEI